MKVIDAELDYHVYASCPECQENMDLVDQDSDHFLAACVFGDADGKANWCDTGLNFECPFCDAKFELGDIKY